MGYQYAARSNVALHRLRATVAALSDLFICRKRHGPYRWRFLMELDHEKNTSSLTATYRFIARLGALSALIFAFALALQGIASLVLSGCER